MAELEPVFKLGLVRPTSSQLKQKTLVWECIIISAACSELFKHLLNTSAM